MMEIIILIFTTMIMTESLMRLIMIQIMMVFGMYPMFMKMVVMPLKTTTMTDLMIP